jgi:hypothetical protein
MLNLFLGQVLEESPDPDRTQGFYRGLFGWGFRRAFDEPNSELGHRYWIVERGELGATHERGRTFLGTDDFWFANVRDPTGISLGLWTSRPPPN